MNADRQQRFVDGPTNDLPKLILGLGRGHERGPEPAGRLVRGRARGQRDFEDVFPVRAEATEALAQSLQDRMAFLCKEIVALLA